MSAKNRADLIIKLFKFVKKEYQVVAPPSNRPVLEHMLYGCCLENSTHEAADEAFAKLQENYFDWNEVRVTTSAELAESCKSLANPQAAGVSLKKTLHGIFENFYQFDLDFLRKENLSKAVQTFQKFNGVSPFVVSYVAQNGLGGHSIPLDQAAMDLFYVLGIVTEEEMTKGRVPGLERTIAKAKGVEFGNLVHQLAVVFASAPFSTTTRDKLLKISSDAKERFPKRASRKAAKEPEPVKAKTKAAPKAAEKPAAKKVAKKTADKPVKKIKTVKATKKVAKKSTKKPAASAKTKKVVKKKSPTKKLGKKKPR
ncbi:MAG: endonuclease III [Mariniblastus sp.]|jgi:endonuclease III